MAAMAAILISYPNDLAVFDLQVNQMLPTTKFRVNWPFGSGGEVKIDFQHVIPMLPTKFQVNCPLGSGDEVKNRFSRWGPWRPSWIPDRNDFSLFRSTSHPDASYQLSSQLAFRF